MLDVRSFAIVPAVALAIGIAGTATCSGARAALTASSGAALVSAELTISGKTYSLPPQVLISGTAPPAYNQTVNIPGFSRIYDLGNSVIATITGNPVSRASARKPVAGSIESTAISVASQVTVTISGALGTLVSITSGTAQSSAKFSVTTAGASATGSSITSGLAITAPPFGISDLTFFGRAPVNFALWQNPQKTATIFLNAQRVTKSAAGKPTGITVEAVDVHYANFLIPSTTTKVSGDIVVAISEAK